MFGFIFKSSVLDVLNHKDFKLNKNKPLVEKKIVIIRHKKNSKLIFLYKLKNRIIYALLLYHSHINWSFCW